MNVRNVDELMKRMGQPGKFQVLVYVFLCFNMAICFVNHLVMVFYAAKTNHHCTVDKSVEYLIPTVMKNNEKQWDGCHIYAGNNTTETMPCTTGWTYYFEDGESNIISEFNLVCDDAYKGDLATTLYFGGVTLGGLLFGVFADKYGRRPVLIFTLFASGTIGVIIVISRTYVTFAVLRFCLGIVIQGLQNSNFVLAMELFSLKYRGRAGLMISVSANIGALVFAVFAYLIKDWKYIQLAVGLLPFVQLVSLLCFIPESIRWHLLHGNFTKAEMIVQKIVTFNNLPFPQDVFELAKYEATKEVSSPEQQKKANILELFRSGTLRKMSFILFLLWFTSTVSFYGLAFNISFLFGNKYLNFGIGVCSDICFTSLTLWIVPRFGRRKPLALGYFVCAIANIFCAVITTMTTDSIYIRLLRTAVALFGKSCAASTLCIIYLFTSELYPTVVRNVSLGANTLWGRIGGMAAPQIFLLGIYTLPSVPYTIIGTLGLLSSILTMLLPETCNKALMDRLGHRWSTHYSDNDVKTISGGVVWETAL